MEAQLNCSCLNLFCAADIQSVLENFMFFPRWVHVLPVVAEDCGIVDLYGAAVFMVWRKIETAGCTVLLAPPSSVRYLDGRGSVCLVVFVFKMWS